MLPSFVTMQSCLAVFKALSTLEKTVDRCRLHLDPDENKLVFIFHCKHSKMFSITNAGLGISNVPTGIVKTHNLGFQECEALQAVFTKDLCPNHIAGPARQAILACTTYLVDNMNFCHSEH